MKKIIIGLLCLVMIIGGCSKSFMVVEVDKNELNRSYGIWLSYLDFDEILKGNNQETYTLNIKTMLSNLESLGIDTIYAHASAFSDAFYNSDILPWSKYVTGVFASAPGFDPFKILVEEAEYRNIKVEAWINPFRSYSVSEMNYVSNSNPIKKWYLNANDKEECLILIDNRYYLNPGSYKVIEYVNKVAKELLDKYGISGIHIDDYFYPSMMDDLMDQMSYEMYVNENGDISRSDYRLIMSDTLVKSLYQTVHQYENKIFSISPHASIETNMNTYYCDVSKWLRNTGYCDVIIPQVYFGFDHDILPFKEVVDTWESLANGRTKLSFGLAAYKVGTIENDLDKGKMEWVMNADILQRQVQYLKEQHYYNGVVLFRYMSMFYPNKGIEKQMQLELSKLQSEM